MKINLLRICLLMGITIISFLGMFQSGNAFQKGDVPVSVPANIPHALTTWAKSYGGGSHDIAYSLIPASDGGYVMAGFTNSFGAGNQDYWVLKIDDSGNVVWQKTYGGGNFDLASAIAPTKDGGYLVTGYTQSFGAGGQDYWVLKLDKSGNVLWQKTFGGSGNDFGQAGIATSDGGYIIAGHTFSFNVGGRDFWILKLDRDGNVTWQKTFGGSNDDNATSIIQTLEGDYVVVGWTFSFGAGGFDAWVLKLDSSGNVLWQKTYGGPGDDNAIAVIPANDGGYIIGGNTTSSGAGSYDAWIFKLDSQGSLVWQKTYGTANKEQLHSIQPTNDGGYIAAGETNSGASGDDVWVFKLDGSGNLSWQRKYGGLNHDHAYAIRQTADSGFIVAGDSGSFSVGGQDIWVLRLDSLGRLGNSCLQASALPGAVSGTSVSATNSNAITQTTSIAAGQTIADVNNSNAQINTQCSSFSLNIPAVFSAAP